MDEEKLKKKKFKKIMSDMGKSIANGSRSIIKSRWFKKLIFPHWIAKMLLVIVSAVLLVYSLGYQNANPIIAYSSYALSAYTLVIVSIRVPILIKAVKNVLYANEYSNKYLSEPLLRAKISLYASSAISVLYAFFKFGAGLYYHSVWLGAIAVYYIVLSVIRFGLVRRDKMRLKLEDETEQRMCELKSGHFCGKLMFLLNIAVTGLVAQMIWQNKYYDYPGFMIYAQAAYTFYCLGIAIYNVLKYRKLERPILSAAKVVSMACALTSLLALQTAMLMQFGSEQAEFIRLMNLLTGSAVCFIVFVMAVWLVHITKREMLVLKEK